MPRLVGYEDFRAAARRRLPGHLFDFIDGGAGIERTLASNEAAFKEYAFPQPVLKALPAPDLGTSIFGQDLSFPLVLAPVGMAGLCAQRGERQAARAAGQAGIPFTLSTVSVCSIAEVSRTSLGSIWFQLYVMRDVERSLALIDKAWESGVRTLVLAVDANVIATRRRDLRNQFGMAPSISSRTRFALEYLRHLSWSWNVGLRGRPHLFGNFTDAIPRARSFAEMLGSNLMTPNSRLGWSDVEKIRAHWPGQLIFKGIMEPEDAARAVSGGADGIWISNHGGRLLDGAPATLSVLPEVAAAVAGRARILIDGGIRSGQDILMALALGADAAVVGRPWAFALGADGEAGVAEMLLQIRREFAEAMALTGCTNVMDAARLQLKRTEFKADP